MSTPSGNQLPPQQARIVSTSGMRYRRNMTAREFWIMIAVFACANFILLGDPRYQWHRFRAMSLDNQHQYSQALAELKTALSINSTHSYDYSLLAGIYDGLGQHQTAVQTMSTAISMERMPLDLADSLSIRAYYRDEAGQIPEAIADYTSAITWAGKVEDDKHHFGLRTIKYSLGNRMIDYYHSKQYENAVSDARRLSEMKPNNESVVAALAKYEAAAGNFSSAEIDAQRAIKLDPTDGEAYYALSTVYEDQHQYAKAISVCERQIQTLPNNPYGYGNRGWFEYKLGNYDAAISDSRKALTLHPQATNFIYFNIGLAYAVQGDWASAKDAYLEAFHHSPAKDWNQSHEEVLAALKLSPHNTALQQADLLFKAHKA